MVLLRHGIDRRGIECGNDRLGPDVTELGDLAALAFRQRMFRTAQQDIGLDTQAGEFAHRVLRRLRLQLACSGDIGHQRDVDRNRLVRLQFVTQLANRLHEGKRFDVAHRAADLA